MELDPLLRDPRLQVESMILENPYDSSEHVSRRVSTLAKDQNLQIKWRNEQLLDECRKRQITKWDDDFRFPEPQFFQRLSGHVYRRTEEDFEGWRLVGVAQSWVTLLGLRLFRAFYAQLYFHPLKWQMALVVKGTTPTSPGDLLADFQNVFRAKGGLQVDSAFTFGEEVRRLIQSFRCRPQLFVTGHSLGGFLAQVATFTVQNCFVGAEGDVLVQQEGTSLAVNAFVFDSPPASRQLDRIFASVEDPKTERCVNLAVTNFVVDVNLVNCCSRTGPHVGVVVSPTELAALRPPTFWSWLANVRAHALRNFEQLSVESVILYLPSAEAERYDARCVPLVHLSARERAALHKIPMLRLHLDDLTHLPAFKVKREKLEITIDTCFEHFLPALRFYVSLIGDELQNCEGLVEGNVRSLLSSSWKVEGKEGLKLRDDIVKDVLNMDRGETLGGLENDEERDFFVSLLVNSVPDLRYVTHTDGLNMLKLWMKLNDDKLVMLHEDCKEVAIDEGICSKVIYLAKEVQGANVTQLPLRINDLDEESQRRLRKTKRPFLGSLVEAGDIFQNLEEFRVTEVDAFDCRHAIAEEFYFTQMIQQCRGRKRFVHADEFAEEIEKSGEQCFILSCAPGMGKSTTLKRIELKLRQSLPHYWIVRLELYSCYKALHQFRHIESVQDAFQCIETNVNQLIDDIHDITPTQKHVIKKVFSAKLRDRQVILLLDAFDEICPMYRNTTASLLRLIKKSGLKILISTRPQENYQILEACEGGEDIVFEICSLERDRQVFFLLELWKLKGASVTPSEASKFLRNFKVGVRWDDDLCGKPLHLKMIAESFPDGCITEEFKTHKDLYRFFVEKNIKQTLKDKLKEDELSPFDKGAANVEKCYALLPKLAFRAIFGDGKSEDLNESEKNLLHTFPFIFIENDFVRSPHRTFLEYFVALHFVRAVFGSEGVIEGELCKKICFEDEHFGIRHFVDGLLSYTSYNPPGKIEIIQECDIRRLFSLCYREGLFNFYKTLNEFGAIDCPVIERFSADETFSFILALESKNFKLIKYMLSQAIAAGVNYQEIFLRMQTDRLMDLAACCEDSEMVHFLIERKDLLKRDYRAALRHENADRLLNILIDHNKHILNEESVIFAAENSLSSLKTLLRRAASSPQLSRWKKEALMCAAHSGNMNCLEYLLENGVGPNEFNSRGETALMLAARQAHADCIELLLKHRASPTATDCQGKSCLEFAAESEIFDSFKFLFDRVDAQHRDCTKLLRAASKSGQKETIQFLLDQGAGVDECDRDGNTCLHLVLKSFYANYSFGCFLDRIDINARNFKCETPLHLAAANTSMRKSDIEHLLSRGAISTAVDDRGWTALHFAASEANIEGCEALVTEISVDAASTDGMTPLMTTTSSNFSHGAYQVAYLLLENGANPRITDAMGRNCLHYAAERGNEKIMRILLELGVSIDDKCSNGVTPLMLAAKTYSRRGVRLLLEAGADPGVVDSKGRTCLHYAAESGCLESVEYLTDKVQVNARCSRGMTPLMMVAWNHHPFVADVLLRKGTDLMAVDDTGRNFLHHVAESGTFFCLDLLEVAKSIPIDSRCQGGLTPLMLAIRRGDNYPASIIVEWLLQNGADPNLTDATGRTCLEQAVNGV